jgi:hypothetical protein
MGYWQNGVWVDDYQPSYYPPWQQPYYQPNQYVYPRLGWQCPNCKACYNPDVQKCWTCGTGNVTTTWNINTSTYDDTTQVNDTEDENGS